MNTNQKKLTIAVLIVFVVLVLFAQWDLTESRDHLNCTKWAPVFMPPDYGPWRNRELASSNFWTWLALGIVYAGLFAVMEKPKAVTPGKPDDLKC